MLLIADQITLPRSQLSEKIPLSKGTDDVPEFALSNLTAFVPLSGRGVFSRMHGTTCHHFSA